MFEYRPESGDELELEEQSGTKERDEKRGWETSMNCESADIMDQQITNINTQFAPNWVVVLHLYGYTKVEFGYTYRWELKHDSSTTQAA